MLNPVYLLYSVLSILWYPSCLSSLLSSIFYYMSLAIRYHPSSLSSMLRVNYSSSFLLCPVLSIFYDPVYRLLSALSIPYTPTCLSFILRHIYHLNSVLFSCFLRPIYLRAPFYQSFILYPVYASSAYSLCSVLCILLAIRSVLFPN